MTNPPKTPPAWDLYPAFRAALADLLPKNRRRLLAAVSGGPDSMVLWDLLERWRAETGGFVAVGHVNHGLRGRAADRDAAFVAARARRQGVPCRVARAPVRAWARRRGKGLEEAARVLRYGRLAEMARSLSCGLVLTAHTLDDQVETLFIHLLRGTGPAGLGGMAPVSFWPVPARARPLLLRPLLNVSRRQILAYLRGRGLPFRRDATNEQPLFLRNRLRPVLQAWERERPGFFQRAARLSLLQRDEEDFWRARISGLSRRVFRRKGGSAVLDLRRFLRYHKVEQRRLLRRIPGLSDFPQVEWARALAHAPVAENPSPKRFVLPGGWMERRRHTLLFHPGRAPERSEPFAVPSVSPPRRVRGRLRLETGTGPFKRAWDIRARPVAALPRGWKRSRWRVFADADKADPGSLACRTWRPGDRFRPLGLAGRKKLQDFFVDQKVPAAERTSIPLLVNRKGIVWVAGHRLSDAVKVTADTRRFLELSARRVVPFRKGPAS